MKIKDYPYDSSRHGLRRKESRHCPQAIPQAMALSDVSFQDLPALDRNSVLDKRYARILEVLVFIYKMIRIYVGKIM